MDGFKRRLNASIQLKLSFTLFLAIFVVAVIAGIFSYAAAFDEAHELQDGTLQQVAALFDRQHLPPFPTGNDERTKDIDETSRVVVQYLADGDKAIGLEDEDRRLPIPVTLPDGLHTLELAGESFRVLVKSTALGERIAVAQETDVRDEISRDHALHTLISLLILVPVLLLIIADLVRKMFQPLLALSAEIDQRTEQDLQPVEEDLVLVEVRPFIVAINRLLNRVSQSIDAQHRFIADAAHELRSPLTAMSLQAERLAGAEMSAQARQRLIDLQRGIERGRKSLDQLLTLAKAQAIIDEPKSSISVQSIYRRVLEDFLPLAESKNIDIGVEGDQDAKILMSEFDLITVVKNIVDNAIRYTPNGGKIDLSVSVRDGLATMVIKDSGPGISADEYPRIFEPFYRILGNGQVGSGLGLSIVKAIADRTGAEVRLAYSDEERHSGLSVSFVIQID